MKRIQNQVAESRYTLPAAILYSVAVWLLAGLIQQGWWVQFGCFALSALMMMRLNSVNVLIRIYSRSISSSFILLSCAAVFLFPSVQGAILQSCFIASLLFFYNSYQDKEATGWTFYTFLLLGLGSTVNVHLLYFVPVYWLIMAIYIYSMSWRTFLASLLAVATPYWFMLAWLLLQGEESYRVASGHFAALASFQVPYDTPELTLPQTLFLGFVLVLGLTGALHFLRTSIHDKIRTRQLYHSFILLGCAATLLLLSQPQHYDLGIRLLVTATSPLIGHFIALTHTRWTNIAFWAMLGVVLILTTYNLWISSLTS